MGEIWKEKKNGLTERLEGGVRSVAADHHHSLVKSIVTNNAQQNFLQMKK